MVTSTSYKKVEQTLIDAGHNPTPELINAVLGEKAKNSRISLETAVSKVLSAHNTQIGSGQTSGQRVTDNGQQAIGSGNTPLEATTLAMAKNLKQRIVSDAFNIVLAELAAGDLGDFVNVPLDVNGALEVDFSEVFEQPKFKTLSPSTPTNSLRLLPSNENENSDESNI